MLFSLKFVLAIRSVVPFGTAQARTRSSPLTETIRFESITNAKSVLIFQDSSSFEIRNVIGFKKKPETFDFIQIGTSFKCEMKMIFVCSATKIIKCFRIVKIFFHYLSLGLSQIALKSQDGEGRGI